MTFTIWLELVLAAFVGYLLAEILVTLGRVIAAAMGARGDGNRSHSIDTHARQEKTMSQPEPRQRAQPVAEPATFAEVKPDPNLILVGPPMVGAYTLRDYLIHYSGDEGVWGKLVPDFYGVAAADRDVFAVFQASARARGMDVGDLVAGVQKHFLAMLIVLTHVGLNVRLADSLQNSHAVAGITKDVYDKTCTALVQTLTRYGTPQEAFPRLIEMVAELEPRIVTVGS